MKAASSNSMDIFKLLISMQVDVNATDINGKTALMWAINSGNSDIAKSLIMNGADANIIDNHGETALMLAELVEAKELVQLLKKYGAEKLNTK